jgi:hypothetical protein
MDTQVSFGGCDFVPIGSAAAVGGQLLTVTSRKYLPVHMAHHPKRFDSAVTVAVDENAASIYKVRK